MPAKKSASRAMNVARKVGAAKAAPKAAHGYEQVFKHMDHVLRKDAGCTTELDYTEQSSWLLFLKYLDALEADREQEAILTGRSYSWILAPEYRWSAWAAPLKDDGTRNFNAQLTGDDLLEFVNGDLFPYLQGFKARADSADTIEYKIGQIFDEIRNRISSGYNLRDVIDQIDKLRFRSQTDKHELSDLYEMKIKNMGNAGRNGGEYYTPRPLIRAMIRVVDPQVGETVYDGALGSAGFLCEAFEYMSSKAGLTTSNMSTLQTKTFYGKEKKPLPFVIGIMNMILHGIDAPNIVHVNTLSIPLSSIDESDRYKVVLANPPFGGDERIEVQQNFNIQAAETAYLFLQHFIKSLKAGGRAGIVIKNTFLSNADSASVALRRMLLSECNLHTILVLPSGTFQGAGVSTVVLFFEKGLPTTKTWLYQLEPGRKMGKTNPLNDADLAEFASLVKKRPTTDNAWTVNVSDLDPETLELTPRNPNGPTVGETRETGAVIREVERVQAEARSVVQALVGTARPTSDVDEWVEATLEECSVIEYGTRVVKKRDGGTTFPVYGGGGQSFFVDQFNREDRMIVSRFGMSPQCVRWVDGKFFLNDSGLTVDTRDEEVLRQAYLDNYLLSMQDTIYFETARGAAQKNMDVPRFRKLPIRYPKSTEAQDSLIAYAEEMRVARERITELSGEEHDLWTEFFRAAQLAAFSGESDAT